MPRKPRIPHPDEPDQRPPAVDPAIVEEMTAPAITAGPWERAGRVLTELLSVRLTDDEQRALGHDLAGVLEEISNQLSREESIKKELKARMAGLEAQRDELATVVRRREQLRPIECVWERNYRDAIARKVRLDSGEIIASRPLREDERQPKLLPDVAMAAAGASVEHSAP